MIEWVVANTATTHYYVKEPIMPLNIAKAPIPATSRASAPNPWDEYFPADDEALVVEFPGQEKDDTDDGKAIRVAIKQARIAANKVDRTCRIKSEVKTVKGRTFTVLTLWTVDRVQRKDKTENETVAEAATSE